MSFHEHDKIDLISYIWQQMPLYGMDRRTWLQVLGGYAGWLMDGYTTIAYALVAVTVSTIFFPSSIGIYGLIATFGGLAVGELARPVGSIILGNFLGDRMGRKSMLTATIVGFSVFSTLKGLLPTYGQVGILAPVLLYILLFMEGLFAGAEYGGGTALAMESVPAEKRSPIGAFVQSGYGTGYFIVSFVFAALFSYYGKTVFDEMGWRILFFTTILPGLLTLIIRVSTRETSVFSEIKKAHRIAHQPAVSLIREGGRPLVLALILTSGLLFINSITFSFYPTLFTLLHKGITGTIIGEYNGYINLISLFGVWIGGVLGLLIVGRRRAMLFYTLIFIILTFPFAYLAFHGTELQDLIIFSLQAFFEAMIFSTLPAFLSETFSTRFRTTGVGFAYNGGGILAGFAISIVLYTSTFTHSLYAAWTGWFFIAEVMMILGIIFSSETYFRNREDRIMN